MVGVQPDEISAILKQQLSGTSTAAELEEVGTVLQVGDGIARVYGLTEAQAGELVEFATGVQAIVLNLEADNVGVVLLGSPDGIREGSIVKRTGTIAAINVGEGYLGRVVDPLGLPIDGKGPITVSPTRCLSSVRRPVSSSASPSPSLCRPASRPSTP